MTDFLDSLLACFELQQQQGYTAVAAAVPLRGIAADSAYLASVVKQIEGPALLVGHSYGGALIAQRLAGEGVSAVTVAIDPAPFRGVLPLLLSALKSGSPVLKNPINYGRAVGLTYEQFRYAFTNVVDESEAHALYDKYSVPGPGTPLFQAASANLNPWTEAKVDTKNPERGPLLIISGEYDNTVPWSIAHAAYVQQQKNPGVTEIKEIPDRGHSLTIDHGWKQVAETALAFIEQHLPKG